MKLLFVFQDYQNLYTGLGHSFIRSLKRKLRDVSVFRLYPISSVVTINRVLNRVPPIKALHFKQQNQKLIQQVRNERPDAILVLKGTDVLSNTIKTLRNEFPKIQLACFNPDDPFNPQACSEEVVQSIRYYHHYFIWSHRLMVQLKEAGAEACHYLQFGTDSEILFPLGKEGIMHDVSFVGNSDQERFEVMSRIAEEIKKQNASFKVSVYGANWPTIAGVNKNGSLNGEDYLKCVYGSKININILRTFNKGSTNMRTFEIPASGGFLMHEASDEAKEIFIEDKEAVYFNSAADLVEKTKYYLDNEDLRSKIAKAGYQKAIAYEQTYDARIDEILKTLS